MNKFLVFNGKSFPISNPLDILFDLQKNTDKLKSIRQTHSGIQITCPFHNNGQENKPSCYINTFNDDLPYLWVHCFTCGLSCDFITFIAIVKNIDVQAAEKWFLNEFGNYLILTDNSLQIQSIPVSNTNPIYLDEKCLQPFRYFHPYIESRHVSFDIAKKFSVGYNKVNNTITFPTWDVNSKLLFIAERSIATKKFFLPFNIEKPVYLLHNAIKEHFNTVIVCEGPIDALVAYSYGFPAVALFGAGTTEHQLDLLANSGIRHFILMYDNDNAGRKGAEKFKNYIGNHVLVTDIIMPSNKDVADCSHDEFYSILKKNLTSNFL